jgi:hypothetical protein
MPRPCTVCVHPQREEIERAIARGEPYRRIAFRYSVSPQAVIRHVRAHFSQQAEAAVQEEVVEYGGTILDQVRQLNAKARQLLEEAAANHRYTGAAAFLKEARELLTLEARLRGELDAGSRVEVHNYLDVRALAVRIARELEDEPELAERVGRVLMELTDGR